MSLAFVFLISSYSDIVLGRISCRTVVLLRGTEDPNQVCESKPVQQLLFNIAKNNIFQNSRLKQT